MDSLLKEKAHSYVEYIFRDHVPEGFAYHNFHHTISVVDSVYNLAANEGLSEEDTEILVLAAYLHDIGFSKDPENHEEFSKAMARQFLEENNYPEDRITKVIECIDATRMDWKGKGKLCQMVKDADLSGLASPDFEKTTEQLRKELVFRDKAIIDKQSWIKENIEFLKNHHYLSASGRDLYEEGKKANLQKLEALDKRQAKKKKKKKQNNTLTIANNKSAQTQFKTALRNHIDLSAIADNKANIMLSVNAVIITVGLPLLIDKASVHNQLYIPTAILAIVSLISMIFATLSTRPIKMSGQTKPENILKKETNLFFFGNYYNMDINEYNKSIKEVIQSSEILDDSIIRDLFFLGKSLGKKFEYLRWCYNFFMYGIAAAVLSYLITMIVSI